MLSGFELYPRWVPLLRRQMLNVGCQTVNDIPLNLKVEFEDLTAAYEKLNVESKNLNVA